MTRARDLADLGNNTSKLEQAGLIQIIPGGIAKGASGSASIGARGTVTFSGTESVSLGTVFSSTYDNYRIVFSDMKGSTSIQDVQFRLRKSGSDNSSNIYYRQYVLGALTSLSGNRNQGTAWPLGAVRDQGPMIFVYDICSPNIATTQTTATGIYMTNSATENNVVLAALSHNLSSSADFDGFTFYPDSGTFSGKVQIYGYNQ